MLGCCWVLKDLNILEDIFNEKTVWVKNVNSQGSVLILGVVTKTRPRHEGIMIFITLTFITSS